LPTNFPQKKYKDKLYYHEVNSIFKAINDIEAAININVGTSNARIPSANIESLDAQKIFGTAALDSLTVGSLRVSEQTELDGQISLGENGTLSLKNNAGIETIKMGLLELGEDPVYGFRVSDGLNTNFLADEEGNVSIRGKIVAINGSEFTGKVNIITGTVIDNLKVGNGVLLDGNTGEIIAGGSRITKDGIDFSHGTITLQNLTIDGQGNLVASNVDLSGKFTITDGEIYLNQGELGGVTITSTGLTAGTVAPSSPYFVLSKTGGANINHGVFTGEAHLTSGTIDGEVVVDGALIAPGVVFDENGPTFSDMSVSLNDGLFVLQNGRLTASQVDLTGVFKVNSGEILGNVNIGSIVVDGESKKVIAGTNELQEDKFLFSSGVIDFGDNFNVSSTNGLLHVKNAELEGKFEGEINVASGVVGGFEIGESILYSPADNPEYSMLILDSQGKITVFQDRVAYGAGHKEDIVLDISQDGLLVDHGKVLIRTAIDGSKEVRVDVSGVRAIRSSQDEVIITGDGIKLKKDGEVSAPLISPDGFNAEFLEDGTITSNKLFQIKPSPVSFVVGEGRLVQTDGSDYGELTIKWPIVETKMDGSPADDIAGYRVYLFGGEYETFQCVGVVGPEPDFPDAAPGSELYNLKIFKQKVEKDTLYDFAVIAFDRLGNESYQTLGNAYVTRDNTVPGAPEFVHIYPGLYFLKVEWELSKAIDFKHFVVEKMVEGGEWEALPDTLSNHFLDKNVQHGVFYKYRVSVVDRSGNMSEYTESQWEAPLGVRASDLEDGSIISEKLAEDIYLQGFLTIGDGAILVPNEGVRMVYEEDQEEPVPHVFPIEYLRILEDNMDPENLIPKGIDVKNILIRNGEIILPDGTDTLVVHGEGETPELKDLSVRNISVSLINGIDLPELKASFDQHVVDFGDYQSEVDARFDGIDASIVNINTDIGEINDELAQINLRIDNIDTAVIGINNDIGDINNELVQIDQEINSINTAIGNIGGDVGTISEDIIQVNARIDNEVSQINLRIDDIDAVISNLDDTIDTRFDTKIEPVITEFNDKLDAKVDKVEGKGLSTEDFTTELKEKLESDDISVNNIYTNIPHEGTIGTADAPFASIYADEIHTSGNTLWLGDTPVLGTDDTTIIIRSDPGQNLKIMSYDGTELVATGLNADVKLQATGAGGRVVMGSDTEIRMTAPQTIVSGNLSVTGDLIVNGSTFTVNTETVEVKDNIIVLNKGQVGSGVSAGLAGIKVDRGDAPDYMIVFDEEEDMFKVGMVGDLETIASQNYVQSQLESVVKDADSLGGIPAEEFLNSRIVGEGYNENGWYIRWGNGLQVCWGVAMVPANTSYSIVTMPAAFNGGFNITITNVYWYATDIAWSISSSTGSTVRVDARTHQNTIPTVDAYGRFIAIGRWK
jgi:predicted  nucleic acid-binding Zn-ribbon protein